MSKGTKLLAVAGMRTLFGLYMVGSDIEAHKTPEQRHAETLAAAMLGRAKR